MRRKEEELRGWEKEGEGGGREEGGGKRVSTCA
jgi:hypothetical protein